MEPREHRMLEKRSGDIRQSVFPGNFREDEDMKGEQSLIFFPSVVQTTVGDNVGRTQINILGDAAHMLIVM